MSLAQALFAPRSIALVGASGDPAKATSRPQRFLRRLGFAGNVFPVNPGRDEIFGEKTYPNVESIPHSVDHAFIMIEDVEGAIDDCGRSGVPVATIFSDGFADRGADGAKRQEKLKARARKLGVRLLGPNSMGLINVQAGATITVNAVLEADAPPAGAASVISQSGTMLGTILTRGARRGLGFAKLVSVGNETDIAVGELVELLVADPETREILLFLETVRDPERLAAAARAAHAARKPVVAYKLGRSRLGARLARTHTGAIAGEDKALDAYFRACGIVRVDMLETLFEIGPLVLDQRPLALKRPPRVAVLTNTGGGAAVVVDRLGELGIETAAPGTDAPIVDTTMGKALAAYGATLNELLAWRGCDAVLAVTGSSAFSRPPEAVAPMLEAKRGAKPFAVFLTPQADEALGLLGKAGIAAFRTPEACADALGAFFRWKTPRKPPGKSTLKWPKGVPRKGRLNEVQALRLFAALGMPVVEHAIAKPPRYAHRLRYPVAVKILDPKITHKTEAGGVVLDVSNEKEFTGSVKRLPRITPGVLVQTMERGIGEAIVGYRDDPVVGPVVLVGAGGTLAELYNDVVVRLAPVGEAEAMEMIGGVKGFAALRGYRGLPSGDLKALSRAVAALSRLALLAGRPVREAEANPVIVKRRGAVAVDAVAVLKEG
jgi:acyl-CoA synthetase (NDP forming)